LQPIAAEVLTALVWAIRETSTNHRLILTCRYDFEFSQLRYFYKQPLEGMRGADLRKKCSRLVAFGAKSQVDEALKSQARRLADGNPRLLEWLDNKIWQNSTVDQVAILNRLEVDAVELREQVLAEALLQQMDQTMGEMLSQGLVFELPVPREALTAVCENIPNLADYINRAVALGLLEVSPDESLRVPRILPLTLSTHVETLHQQAAEVLYRLWYEEAETLTEEECLEIHRLALLGKQGEIAAEIASSLANRLWHQSRFREAVNLCKSTLEIKEDYRVLKEIGYCEQQLGNVDQALNYCQQALNLCPSEDKQEKAYIYHYLASIYTDTGEIEKAIALYQHSLEIKERIGNIQGKATTLHQLAGIYANTGKIDDAIALYQQVLEIDERMGNVQGKAATLHQLAIIYANKGKIDDAIALYEKSLKIKERIGDTKGKASTLHQLAGIYANKGEMEKAIALYEESLKIKERIGNIQSKAATLHQLAGIYANKGEMEKAIALYQQSLEITERIRDVDTKAATLHELGRIYAKMGKIDDAIAHCQQSLEITERIGNVKKQSSTLAILGQLLAYEKGDFVTALEYLQQSLEILQRIQSPNAETIREIINDVQQMANG
jgi:tetratricopeptide (TPR) repeat protein